MPTDALWMEADMLAHKICGCADASQHRADVAELLAFREAGRLAGMEQAAVIVDQLNREGPYRAIGAATAIRAAKGEGNG